jgi:hypothetical protein
MTQEDKELLLKDLCARLPYGVKYCRDSWNYEWDQEMSVVEALEDIDKEGYINYHKVYKVWDIKPYLRPMSSMTSKEWVEFCDCSAKDEASWVMTENRQKFIPFQNREDYLNSKHFDHRGLIPMGLALEAPPGMYNKEESEEESGIPVPKTVDEAISTLEKILSDEDREYLLKNGAISMHDSLGRWIRNEWGLWTGSELKNELEKKGFEHPDDMSNYIIEEFIKYLNNKV